MSVAKMFLNVNLTPPPGSGDTNSCTTPKTPEILNSIISLTHTPVSRATTQIAPQGLLSPPSSTTSPSEESLVFATRASFSCHGLPTPTSPPLRPSALTSSATNRCSSPPKQELPSPVRPLEATKSALIKEGLKHQIRTKLQAAGVPSQEVVAQSPEVKEENLTPEDEERRRRRRERNKVAATKCRNKKKEKTCILISESEDVEGENLKLKSEIQRLLKEKCQLQKILHDPSHTSTCRHSCAALTQSSLPVVVVSPPDDGSSDISECSTLSYDQQQCSKPSPAYTLPQNHPSSTPFSHSDAFPKPSAVNIMTDAKEYPITSSYSTVPFCELLASASMTDDMSSMQNPSSLLTSSIGAANEMPDTESNFQGTERSVDSELTYGSYTDEFLRAATSECESSEISFPSMPYSGADSPSSTKSTLTMRRARHFSESRFNPYGRSDLAEFDMPVGVQTPSDEFVGLPGCGSSNNHYSIDISQNHYYPPCTFESI